MSTLEKFNQIFPSGRLKHATPEELRYTFRWDSCAKAYEYFARKMILHYGLALTADRETWYSNGVVTEHAIVIRPVPEPDVIERAFPEHAEDCRDEVPGEEELNSIWNHEEGEWNEN